MKLGLRNIEWGDVGAQLARADDNEQAAFFKAFVKECVTWGTQRQVEQQLSFVNRLLTPEEREVLSMLGYEGNNEC